MAERMRRRRASKRSLIGPLAFLATGAVASAMLWYVLSGAPGNGMERLEAADRQALESLLRSRSAQH